jgi:RNA polymerase sigma factor (sigma-70 family)
MTAKLEKNVVRSEQNSEQFNKDRASARTIESGVENLQRILCRFRCTLLCLKSELSQPNPQNEIVSYCKNNESVDENDENRSFLAAELLKTIQKQLTRKNHYTKTFANKFCRYRLNNQTLNKLVHVFNSSYKAGMIELPDNDYRDAVAQMAEAQKQIETGQDELIQRHQGLVSNLANSKGRMLSTIDRQDLRQEGYLGLLNAVDRYNYRHGACFMTFAYYQVRQNIDYTMSSQFKNVKIPLNVISKIAYIASISQNMTKELGREPTLTELSRELNMESQEINDFKLINSRGTSTFEAGKQDGYFDITENMPDSEQKDITDLINEEQCKEIITDVINSMKQNNRTVLTLRYGLNGDAPLSRDQIGIMMGLTGERVRQIETNALKQLARNSKLIEIMKALIDQQKSKQKK